MALVDHLRCVFSKMLFILGLFLLAPPNASAAELERITVQFNWLDQFEFAGFYIAKEQGFYNDVGLDVSFISFSKGETSVVDAVLSGQAQYGVNYTSLIVDYLHKRPVVALGALWQESPLVLMSREASNIKVAGDLLGRRVMIGGDALNSAPILALLFRHGLSAEDIIKVPHSHDVRDMIDGKTDAMTAYISNEPFIMEELQEPYRIFDPKDSGLSFYEDLIFTSQKEIQDHPLRTKAFLDATLRGWAYAFEHIEETAQLIFEKYNSQGKSLDSLVYEGRELKKIGYVADVPFGSINLQKLEKIADIYRLMGITLPQEPLSGFLWNNAPAKDQDAIQFTPEEQAFIDSTVVKAATTTSWAPFSFVEDSSQKATGIGHAFWSHITKVAGLKTVVTPFEQFSDELESIRNKTQDVIYSTGLAAGREDYALFTEPYASFPLAIATSKEENFIPDASHLTGEKIAIGRNFTAHRMMKAAYPELDYVPVDGVQDGLQMVSRGDAYAFIDVMPVLAHSINQYGFTNLKISGDTGLIFDLRIMIRKDYPELLTISNKIIASMPVDLRQEFLNKWVNVQYQQAFDYKKYWPYIVIVVLIVAGAFLRVQMSKRQAQRDNRAKSEFLALMSHDLRTPLNAIMGFSDLMRNKAYGPLGDPRYEEYVNDIHNSGTLLVSLINDILDLSKIEAGKYDLAEDEVQVGKLIDTSLVQCSNLAKQNNVGLRHTITPDRPILRGDERALMQILNNIISNAIKFSHAGEDVQIDVTYGADGALVISVKDRGIGMSAKEIRKVLEPFGQADRSQARTHQGTGLGLYLSHSLMTLFAGELIISSSVGVGTTVSLKFPADRTITSSPDGASGSGTAPTPAAS